MVKNHWTNHHKPVNQSPKIKEPITRPNASHTHTYTYTRTHPSFPTFLPVTSWNWCHVGLSGPIVSTFNGKWWAQERVVVVGPALQEEKADPASSGCSIPPTPFPPDQKRQHMGIHEFCEFWELPAPPHPEATLITSRYYDFHHVLCIYNYIYMLRNVCVYI